MTALEKSKPAILAALILIVALALRISAAMGDLATDEVWTLRLLHPITNPFQIFWKINHDNNHYLNSLWLYATGPYAPALLQRSLSIAFGVASVAVAGLWARRQGVAAIAITMGLFALSYGMVGAASEARGYAGFTVFALLALHLSEQVLGGINRRWLLALVFVAGVLCHLLMIQLFVVLGLWLLIQAGLYKAFRALWPSALLLAPVTTWTLYLLHSHQFAIGILAAYDRVALLQSFSTEIKQMTGVPGEDYPSTYLSLLCAVIVLAVVWRKDLGQRFSLYMVAILFVPVAYAALQIANTNQPRYFLVSGIAYLLLLGELAAIAWRRNTALRLAAIAVLLMFAAKDTVFLQRMDRGHYRASVAAMTQHGPARYASNDPLRAGLLVPYYATALKASASYVADPEWCAAPPDWYVVYTFSHDPPAATITAGPAACPGSFGQPRVFPYWGPSGCTVVLYRRDRQ